MDSPFTITASDTFQVLYVDSTYAQTDALRDVLGDQAMLTMAETAAEALDQLAQDRLIDLVIINETTMGEADTQTRGFLENCMNLRSVEQPRAT